MNQIFTNKKIGFLTLGLFLACMVSLGFFVQSCSQENDLLSSTTVDSQKANAIASDYVILQGNQYKLNLSEDKALSLGISKADYDRMLTEIQKTNDFIIKQQSEGFDVDINDPKFINKNVTNVRLKSDTEQYGGFFNIPDENTGGSFFGTVPNGMNAITLTASTGCLYGGSSGYVNFGGQQYYYSATGWCGGSTTITLNYSSGGNVSITGTSFCSGGATVTVVYVKK